MPKNLVFGQAVGGQEDAAEQRAAGGLVCTALRTGI